MTKLDPNNRLDAFIIKNMKASPTEAKILRKVYRKFKKAGDPIVNVWDSEQDNPITDETEFFRIAFNLDEFRADTKSGGWIVFVMGEGWDCLPNYTTDLDPIMDPITDWISENMD